MRRPIVLAVVGLAACLPATAAASEQTLTLFSQPHTINGYEAEQQLEIGIPTPTVDGYVVGLEADVVDTRSATVPALAIKDVMLHHIVFSKIGAADPTCPGLLAQRFYAEGEEHSILRLPAGYGYPSAANASWAMVWMLMNHRNHKRTVYVRYRIRYVTGETLTPVTPYWLDVRNCKVDPIFDVPGVGAARHVESSSAVTIPTGSRIVAAGGHVHGGGIDLTVRDLDCVGRPLYTSTPTWGFPSNPYYTVRPILHEPGPIHMGAFTDAVGIPVAAGHRIRLDATYDNTRPHARVMGITVAFVAADPTVTGCLPIDGTNAHADPTPAGRATPPVFTVPLFYEPGGRARRTTRIAVPGRGFNPTKVRLRRGQTLTWSVTDPERIHTITWASGPKGARAFSSPPFGLTPSPYTFSRKFTKVGTYRFYCSLHPATMVQVVRVTVR